jgi:hypothetical protein
VQQEAEQRNRQVDQPPPCMSLNSGRCCRRRAAGAKSRLPMVTFNCGSMPVRMMSARRVITTPCGHTFCHHCIHLCLRGILDPALSARQAIDTLRYEDGTVVQVVATADPICMKPWTTLRGAAQDDGVTGPCCSLACACGSQKTALCVGASSCER